MARHVNIMSKIATFPSFGNVISKAVGTEDQDSLQCIMTFIPNEVGFAAYQAF